MVSGRGTIRRREQRIYKHRLENNLCSKCGCKLRRIGYRNCYKCRKKIKERVNKERKWRYK